MATNIPGLFAIVQGARAQVPAPLPIPAMPGGFDEGGGISFDALDSNAYNTSFDPTPNIPGYDLASGTAPAAAGGSGGDPNQPPPPPGYTINPRILLDIATKYGKDPEDPWVLNAYNANKDYYDNLYAAADAKELRTAGGTTSGTDNTAAYLHATEAANQLAFEREKQAQAMQVNRYTAELDRQKATQDQWNMRDQLLNERKKLANDAVSSALHEWTANVGQANIPGIDNYRPFSDPNGGSAIMSNAPVLGFNPSMAFGKQLNAGPQAPEPNIPSVNF